jgi:hypothetical protein
MDSTAQKPALRILYSIVGIIAFRITKAKP